MKRQDYNIFLQQQKKMRYPDLYKYHSPPAFRGERHGETRLKYSD